MHITVSEQLHSYLVRFAPRQDVIDAIKTIPGRQWKRDLGAWQIPKTSERALRRFLARFDGSQAAVQVQKPYRDPQTFYPTCTNTEHPPWAHQVAALRFLVNKDAALLEMWMRTGKSRVIVDYVVNLDIPRTLIVCPKTVIPVWPTEFATFGGRPSVVVPLAEGSAAQKQQRAQRGLDDATRRRVPYVAVMSYGALSGRSWVDAQGVEHTSDQLQEWCVDAEFDLLVLDEIQRAKAPGGKTALYLYRLAYGIPTRIGLSGTPFEHSPLDAYGIYRVLNPSIFGTNFSKFREQYAELEPIPGTTALRVKRERGTGKEIYKNTQELRQKVDSIRFYAGANVLTLPPVVHTVVPVQLAAKTEQMYTMFKENFISEHGDKVVTASNAGVLMTRLQQITSGWVPFDGEGDDEMPTRVMEQVDTAKLDVLKELMEDLPAHEPLVIFARFHADLDAIHTVCEAVGRSHCELSGRRNDLTAWQHGDYTVIVCQIDAGAVGIRLDRASRAIYFSYSWRQGNYQQSLERIRHPTKTQTCFIDHLVVQLRSGKLSIDEHMRRTLGNLEEVIRELLAAG